VPSIQAFVLPIIIGILAGVFSSLLLAGTLWELFDGLKNKKKEKAE
jgi:preprotein translocase subunit SecF